MKVEELIDSIKRQEIVIPEFQREFVWSRSRVKELFRSLFNDYPVGGVLIWKTSEPPHLKGLAFRKEFEVNKTYHVLLDGQQRSTALYMLITGEIPPYYNENEISDDPRTLAFNLYSGEFKFWLKSSMGDDESWQLVTDLMTGRVNHTSVAISVSRKFQRLKALKDFNFDYSIKDRSREFGEIRTLIESVGLEINFASRQIWKILLPSRIIRVTIDELESLYHTDIDKKNVVDQAKFKDFWATRIVPEAEMLVEKHADLEQLITIFNDNFSRIQSIKRMDIFRQEIPSSADFSDAIDIFDKINTQGVRLGNAELALTHMTAIWPDTRRKMKDYLNRLSSKNFNFNLTFTTRLLILAACGRASLSALAASSYEPIRSLNKDELETAWSKCEEIFSYLLDVLRSEKITNSDLLKSKNVLFPPFYYLLNSDGTFDSSKHLKSALFWMHNALIWGRYSGSADTKLEEDVNIIKSSETLGWETMIGRIIDQRGRIKIEATDLEGEGLDSRFFSTFYIMLKHKGAKDWFSGVSLDRPKDSDFADHRHHIFPKALLERNGYSEHNKLQSALINEIANFTIITDKTNIKISDDRPSKYLSEVKNRYPQQLEKHLIPTDQGLWELSSFEGFLQVRRELIASAMNDFLAEYKYDLTDTPPGPRAQHLWSMPESGSLEFKETWQYDVFQSNNSSKSVKNAKLQLSCIKTIAGFINSHGGDLLIGVSDNNVVEGLERDAEFMGGSLDKLEQNIAQTISNSLGMEKSHLYKIDFVKIDEKTLCHIHVQPARSTKTWVSFGGDKMFFVRQGNGTRSLDPQQADQYWSERQNHSFFEQ